MAQLGPEFSGISVCSAPAVGPHSPVQRRQRAHRAALDEPCSNPERLPADCGRPEDRPADIRALQQSQAGLGSESLGQLLYKRLDATLGAYLKTLARPNLRPLLRAVQDAVDF